MKFQPTRQGARFGARREEPANVNVEAAVIEDVARAVAEVTESDRKLSTLSADQQKWATETHDSEHWFAVNFENRAQKEAALKALGLFDIGDKYVDGREAARSLVAMLRDPRACAEAADALSAMLGGERPRLPQVKASARLRGLVRR